MDKITEEILTNLIRRVEELEKGKTPEKYPKKDFNLATPGQLHYIEGMGGSTWKNMTKSEASKLIEALLRKKKENQNYQKERTPQENQQEVKIIQNKQLTKEEIEEIGEDAFL